MSWNIQTNGDQLQISCVRAGHIVHVLADVECTAADLGALLAHMEQAADEHARKAEPKLRGVLSGSLSVHDASGNDITQPPSAA